jgi:pilus assembly protein CpaF
MLSVRKFARVPISMERLIEIGSIPIQVSEVLKAVVGARRNVLISGDWPREDDHAQRAVGFSRHRGADGDHRDSAELQLRQELVVRLETRPRTSRGKARSSSAPGQNCAAHAADRICRRGSAGESL